MVAEASAQMLVRKEPETAPLCPQCGDAMQLARKLPPLRLLSGLVVHLCERCGYVGASDREPEPPPPKWLQPKRGSRYSLFSRPLASAKERSTEPGPCGGSIINTAVCKQAAD